MKHLKQLGTRPGIIYGSFKVQKKCVEGCPPFRPLLSASQTPTYKLAKFLVPILEPLALAISISLTNTQSKIRLSLPLKLLSKIPVNPVA